MQGIGAQADALQVHKPGGDITYAVVPPSAAVHLGRLEGEATVMLTEYTPSDGCGAADSWLRQPLPAADASTVANKSAKNLNP